LKKNHQMQSLLLDLRNNPGGVLEDAIRIVNMFIPKGKEILSTKGKVKQWDKTYKTTSEPITVDMPLVVLINRNSASASEIVAGALQDLDRAVIVGERSYGKGLVQSSRNLPYDGTLKITTSKYYIPSGRLIQAIDYTRRNEDGSVARVPKEKMKEFKTANGRSVYDGGGILPDKEMESEKMKNIVFYLLSDFVIFDYATQYVNNHPSIAPIAEYDFTDKDFEEFKEFVKKRNFTYDKQSEKSLEELRKILEFEGYYDGAEAEFAALEKKLNHNLEQDLDNAREEIKEFIALELSKRYYFQRGEIIQSLKKDKILDTSVAILKNPELYKKILLPPATGKKG
ncbi:MAG: peptidase S41, partial [Bacteroidaceae bacterium]|nr:peptidase S41 [Bacteroidaceae bacterium]